MDVLSISEVAEQTGFSPSTLRFYEGRGLVRPARTATGYRRYGPEAVEVLHLIARAKRLGLSLEEIRDLVALFGDGRCAPVQRRLGRLLQDKIAASQAQVGALVSFTAGLRRAAEHLGAHTPDGPCDERCGCTTEVDDAVIPAPVRPAPASTGPEAAPIACSLGATEVPARLAAWQDALRAATGREAVDGGVRVHLPPGTPVSPLAALIEAEQACCRFFAFTLRVAADGTSLEINAPDGAEAIVDALAGAPGA